MKSLSLLGAGQFSSPFQPLIVPDQSPFCKLFFKFQFSVEPVKEGFSHLERLLENPKCEFCQIGSYLVDEISQKLASPAWDIMDFFCRWWGLHPSFDQCTEQTKELVYNLWLPAVDYESGIFSMEKICGHQLGVCPVSSKFVSFTEFNQRMLDERPAEIKNNTFVDDLYKKIRESETPRKTVRVIQIADPHADFLYKEGGIINCQEDLCCHADSTVIDGQDPIYAGKWGDYDCDTPMHLLENVFDFIKENQHELKAGAILWTGDNTPHNPLETDELTLEKTIEYTAKITDLMQTHLAGKTDLPFYPLVGNHDVYPINMHDFSAPGQNPIIKALSQKWNQTNWLQGDSLSTFNDWGYYAKPLTLFDAETNSTVETKGTVLSLNTQACNTRNWMLSRNSFDPGHHIEWLEAQLTEIEKNEGAFAWIVGHIDADGCLEEFGERLWGLQNRFQHIIRFTTFAHYHTEEFRVVKSLFSFDEQVHQKPINTHWLGASLTSYGGGFGSSNPAFTVFDFDAEYMVPINVHTYALNLSEANQNDSGGPAMFSSSNSPVWSEQHDFVNEYNLTDMSPSSLFQFTTDLYRDGEVAAHFKWNTYRRHYEKPDPETAKHDMYFYCFREVEVSNWNECMSKGESSSVPVDTPFFGNAFQEWMMEALIGEWMVDA